MAYDESMETVVIAGGQDLDRAFSDMWTWSGSSWILLDSKVPTDRGFHAMVYAPDANSIVIYGGRDGDILLNDMWTWNGVQWTQIDGEWILKSQTWVWSSNLGWRVVSGTE
jgi:hypothetical protein